MASSNDGWGGFLLYRLSKGKTLILSILGLLMGLAVGLAVVWADDTGDWPAPVNFPQRSEQDPSNPVMQSGKPGPASSGQFADGAPGIVPEGKKKLRFKRRSKQEAGQKTTYHAVPSKPSDEQADPPASPYPLLRLPIPIITDQGVVPAGIYLIKTELTDPKIGSQTFVQKAPKAVIDGEKPLLLTQKNQVVARILIHKAVMPDENKEETGTSSPITTADPKIPVPIRVNAELSPDQRTIHLTVNNGKHYFESDDYAVGTDLRHKLTF